MFQFQFISKNEKIIHLQLPKLVSGGLEKQVAFVSIGVDRGEGGEARGHTPQSNSEKKYTYIIAHNHLKEVQIIPQC